MLLDINLYNGFQDFDNKMYDWYGARAVRAFSNSTIQLFNNLYKSGDEDVDIEFTKTDFTRNFSSSCGNLTKIKITSSPIHGTLKLSSDAVSLNQEIPINSISNLTYIPSSGYIGSDSFSWNGSNGGGYAPSDTKVDITITEINNTSSSRNSDVVSSSQTEPFSSSSSSLSSSPATNHDSSWVISTIVVPSVAVGVAITTAAGFILYRHGVLTCFRRAGMVGVEMGTHELSTSFQAIFTNVKPTTILPYVETSTMFQSTLSHVESSIAESVGHFSNEMGTQPATALQTIFTNG